MVLFGCLFNAFRRRFPGQRWARDINDIFSVSLGFLVEMPLTDLNYFPKMGGWERRAKNPTLAGIREGTNDAGRVQVWGYHALQIFHRGVSWYL